MAYLFAKHYLKIIYGIHNRTFFLQMKITVRMTLLFYAMSLYELFRSEIFHISNHRFYRQTRGDQQLYRAFDEELDLYRYVDDIKHNYNYKEGNIWKIKRKYIEELEQHEEK